jgi:hypothetical protein
LAAKEAAAIAEELESRGRERNLEGAKHLLDSLEQQVTKAQRQLAVYLGDGKRPGRGTLAAVKGRSRRH